ncbi:hypothetical protein COV20_00785 [Candidatus Woesearchaeota archaeon CG10_big_fil_rev_8_21_14_0_10_45_16]|nr:MAG: hypothetical protein COV20_00785 [Candidatus Woesearchaeota archaeon CG10_big_fil_rev_8_21_14_0_10_45_16]
MPLGEKKEKVKKRKLVQKKRSKKEKYKSIQDASLEENIPTDSFPEGLDSPQEVSGSAPDGPVPPLEESPQEEKIPVAAKPSKKPESKSSLRKHNQKKKHHRENKDKTRRLIIDLLKSRTEGLTISEVMDKLNLARHTILARLHALVGEGKVVVRQVNMAKLHYWKATAPPEEIIVSSEKEHPEQERVKVKPLHEEHFKKAPKSPLPAESSPAEQLMDIASIKKKILGELRQGTIKKPEALIKETRAPLVHIMEHTEHPSKRKPQEYLLTGIPGFDELLGNGIPRGSAILVAGGAGSGKTIFSLQTLYNHALSGEKCLYMSFEEPEDHLIHHMEDFGWDPLPLIKKGNLMVKRFNPFDITRNVDALLLKAKGELLIDIEPILFPDGFVPKIIVIDSLTAIASAFSSKEDSYRVYIEQLFRFFEKMGATSFLITETKQIPTVFSTSGVEEFLADGVIVLYNLERANVRESAIEVLKMRGSRHVKKIVAMQISDDGIVVFPGQEVFEEIGGE